MPTVVLKLFADKVPDGRTTRRLYASLWGSIKITHTKRTNIHGQIK